MALKHGKMIRLKQEEKRNRHLSSCNRKFLFALLITFVAIFVLGEIYIPPEIVNVRELYITVVITLGAWLSTSVYRLFFKTGSAIIAPLVFPGILATTHLILWLFACLLIGHRYSDIALLHMGSITALQVSIALTLLASDTQSICLFGFQLRIKSSLIGAICLYIFVFLCGLLILVAKYSVRHFIGHFSGSF